MMKEYKIILFLLLTVNSLFSQSYKEEDYLAWSSVRKLTPNVFEIKTTDLQTTPSFAQFTLYCEVNGFDFLTRNFNKKVHNYFMKSASWIDTTYNTISSIKYQQTLFDLSEIYARRFRKELKENKKKIVYGTQFVKELNSKVMTDFSKRRVVYDAETKSGSNVAMQKKWEIQIKIELQELKLFSSE